MARPAVFKSCLHEISTVYMICLAQFLAQGGVLMALSTKNIILQSFNDPNFDHSQAVWFMGSFALTVGTFILISGKIGDVFGLKLVFVVGWVWVSILSIITGFSYYSKSVIFFIICRALQGIGFALILPCGMGILGTLYPNGERKNIAFGCVGALGPSGAFFGAFMAAVIAQLAWWPWVFWIMGIVAAIGAVISYWVIPMELTNKECSTREKLRRIDTYGSLTGVAGLVLLNFVWTQGPVVGWGTAYIIILLVVSLALTGIFFYLEVKVIEMPLLPAGVFNRKIGLCLLCLGLGWGSFGIWQYYYWSLLLDLRHYTPIHGGLTYLTFCIMGIIAALLCGFIMSRTSPSYIISFASIAFMCGCIMLSVTPVKESFFRMSFGQLFILVWGMDLSFPAASLILSDNLPIEQQGMAGLLVTTVTNFSVSLILGISSTAEIEVFRRTGDTLLSYRAALYLGIGVSGLGVLCSFVFIYQQLKESKQIKEQEKMGEIDQENHESTLRPTTDKSDLTEQALDISISN